MAGLIWMLILLNYLMIPSWSEECGHLVVVDKIANAMRAELGEFPWMVVLIYGEHRNVTGCAGSLLTKKFVLTAAHCVTGKTVKQIGNVTAIRVGEYDLATDVDCVKEQNEITCAPHSEDVLVDAVFVHSNYSNKIRGHNDIALVKLVEDVEYGEYVQPICLPNEALFGTMTRFPTQFTIAGWGITENDTYSDVLLKAKIPLASRSSCGASHICAGGVESESCRGDSGGPLMFKAKSLSDRHLHYYIVGVTAYGPKECAKKGIPAVYTNTSVYLEWIYSIIDT